MCDNNKDVSLLNKKPNSKINKLLKEQDTFIPELRKSNEELKKSMLIHGNKEYIIETSKEERKNEPLIEMTLSLGILEPKEEEEDINEILLPTKTEDNVIPKLSIKSPISKDAITVIEQDTDISTSKAIQSDGEQNTSTIITPDHILTREEIGFEPIVEKQDNIFVPRIYKRKKLIEPIKKSDGGL